MTEDEGEMIWEMKNKFYKKFSKLIAECLDSVPKHLEDAALATLQDSASAYGSDFKKYQEKR